MTYAKRSGATFVLAADGRSARLLYRDTLGALHERWTAYAADDKVRALAQSPDTRVVVAAEPATWMSVDAAERAFASDVTARLRETRAKEPVTAILVIAPLRFVYLLRRSFGATLWADVRHVVPRDETGLTADGLRLFVNATLADGQASAPVA